MLSEILRRFRRSPKLALGVTAFALVLSFALCGLHWSNEMERINYEEGRRTIPVTLTVTNLTGMKTTGLKLPHWAVNTFTGSRIAAKSMSHLVKDVKVKMSTPDVTRIVLNGEERTSGMLLVGISDPEVEPRLRAQSGNRITWFPGYDESILQTEEPLCILPESWMPEDEGPVELYLELANIQATTPPTVYTYQVTLTAAAVHRGDENTVYCSYLTLESIFSHLSKTIEADSLTATVIDNNLLPEVETLAENWFAKPDLKGEKTPWGYSWYIYYPFALKIDDAQLKAAAENMENSILMNKVCTVLVFVLSAGASFFVGFLMVRSRKREITILRTLGTPPVRIFLSFALEQMLCVLAGTALGGAAFLWKPLNQLELFLGIYTAGLSLALLIFLSKNLMTTMKEDE